MKIRFLGAAQTVTGSCFMMEALGKRFAVDCGMHQGNKEIDLRNTVDEVYDPKNIDFFLITHAHIDHSGLLPRMVKKGFKGPIYLTPPTKDLLEIMLLDSAHIQEMEAEWQTRKAKRHGKKAVEPLYTQNDAEKVLPLFVTVEYEKPFEPVPGVTVTYRDAGHILGSSFIRVNIQNENTEYKMIFSGDLGRPNQLLVSDPSKAEPADYLFLESTYGDRNHKNEETSMEELAEAIAYSYERGEKVVVPAFAVERSQEIIYSLYLLHKRGKLPKDMPVYLDSPMAIAATEVFRKHPDYFDPRTQKLIQSGENPLDLPNLRFTKTRDESIAINEKKGPAVIISASGMCNAGRIKHHLRHNLWRDGASVVFVGFQAKGTPGRKIVDGARSIRIFGEDVNVQAKVFTIGGFSAHAGQTQILDWLEHFDRPEMKVFLVHGEYKGQQVLADLIRERFQMDVHIPAYLEECELKPGAQMEQLTDPQALIPRIDWEYVLGETETKMSELRKRLDAVTDKSWLDQTELRDRLLEINSDISSLISEL